MAPLMEFQLFGKELVQKIDFSRVVVNEKEALRSASGLRKADDQPWNSRENTKRGWEREL